MIQFTDIQKHYNLPFDQYIKLPGYSHSFLKSQIAGVAPMFKTTPKVELGKLVDAILMPENELDIYHQQLKEAESIAEYMKYSFGSLISGFQSQVSITGNMHYLGLTMPFKVRLDWAVPNVAVIDFKVTSEVNFKNLIEHMKYDNQLFVQAHAYGCKMSYLLIYSTKKKKADLIQRPLNDGQFWKDNILKFGSVQ